MTESQQPEGGKAQQINLQQIASQFMTGLQRHFDMLAFNLASREAADEEAYNRRINAPRVQPSAAHHQNFEQMQAYAHDLLMRQVIGDSLNLAVTCLNNAHFFLALVKASKGKQQIEEEAHRASQESQKAFLAAQIDEKFNRLEKDYGIMSELEDTVISLGFALQALVQHRGIVQESHIDASGELAIELKSVEVLSEASGDQPMKGKLVDRRKVFNKGEPVRFSDLELQLVLVTLAAFADALFKSVAEFARRTKEGEIETD